MGIIEKNNYGLVGKNISYSFSESYFEEKFKKLGLEGYSYRNFDLSQIEEFTPLIQENKHIKGLNVTIPYKEAVIPYLDRLNKKAKKIGAVNTIKFTKKGLKGYNTDIYGFKKSIKPFLTKNHTKALILGTGGASKAVAFVFGELGIKFKFVSRRPKKNQLLYTDLNEKIMKEYTVLVNCTPLGTFPNIEEKPNIPYQWITDAHLLFDLIYNPEKSAFLREGENQGAAICNGLRMLELQAEKAWKIWNS
ncbi:shikimate dehydrogenase [Maribacter polysiphoniae]|uniref:Shikimate dehydrogenase n=1 Tax=Maribacter polysiphoniae TaxID=429344 RepID=A0A316DW72_9FLAO|nr:shikimate dehydrogenase [Maribacter polysiphoniae]MBD1263021.1 shikimate dehydrogenase [Maribacter polysiphoniae]PWK22046.1 shikimate dehydrogenase [Maribacter polysiphoniae]